MYPMSDRSYSCWFMMLFLQGSITVKKHSETQPRLFTAPEQPRFVPMGLNTTKTRPKRNLESDSNHHWNAASTKISFPGVFSSWVLVLAHFQQEHRSDKSFQNQEPSYKSFKLSNNTQAPQTDCMGKGKIKKEHPTLIFKIVLITSDMFF